MTTTATKSSTEIIELAPSYKLPLVLIVSAPALFVVQPWLSLAIALFGIFLTIQAATLRLQFTATDLDIYRSSTLIRRFPYQDWQHWEIFWTPVPILFYFREVKSIHFLPILFDPKMLETALKRYCPINRGE